MKPLKAVLDDSLIAPAHQPVRCGSVKKEVLSSSFPNEVPRVFGVDAEQTAFLAIDCLESSTYAALKSFLAIGDRVFVAAGARGHETYTENTSIGRITKSVHLPMAAPIRC